MWMNVPLQMVAANMSVIIEMAAIRVPVEMASCWEKMESHAMVGADKLSRVYRESHPASDLCL